MIAGMIEPTSYKLSDIKVKPFDPQNNSESSEQNMMNNLAVLFLGFAFCQLNVIVLGIFYIASVDKEYELHSL